jgi:hypothetical protein
MHLWATLLMDVKFDWTISLGSLISAVTFLFLGGMAWADLRWRVSNLEKWRTEHMVDSDSRDNLISTIADIAKKLQWVDEARQRQQNAPYGKRRLNDI